MNTETTPEVPEIGPAPKVYDFGIYERDPKDVPSYSQWIAEDILNLAAQLQTRTGLTLDQCINAAGHAMTTARLELLSYLKDEQEEKGRYLFDIWKVITDDGRKVERNR